MLGVEHPDTLVSLNNLAFLYQSQESFSREAEAALYPARVLEGSERVFGPDHPNTLGTVNNLAGIYQSQGRYGEAEPLYRRAFRGQ